MQLLDDIPAINRALFAFDPAGLPAAYREKMVALAGEVSIVPKATGIAEVLYAAVKSGDLAGDGLKAAATLCGQLANHVGTYWGTLSEDGRGMKIYRAMRRELGETTTPAEATDPAINPTYVTAA